MLTFIENLINFIFRILPQRHPQADSVKKAKLVAHRGAHSYGLKENTLKGFEFCINHNIWGIEFDIRWTKDHQPILLHDANAARIYNRPDIIISEITAKNLRKEIPEIPRLAEVIQHFSGKIHFMIELKECFPNDSRQIQRLKELLAPLQPMEDYHFLTIHPAELLPLIDFPRATFLAVSFFNTKSIARFVYEHQFGGHCGHFLLMTEKLKKRYKEKKIKIGTGYVASQNSLYREINRGVKWIFTNKPIEMQKILEKMTT